MNKINWTDARIGDSALVTSENKMGVILKDYGRKFHLRFADGSEKTYDASELIFFNTDDDYKRGGSIKKGDTWEWHTVEYDSKKGNNYKVVKNIEITDIDSKGQVIGRVVGTSNQFIIRDPQKNLKSKVSKMETGGDIERGGAHMYIELKDSDIVVYHGDAFKIYKNAKPMFVINSAKKGSWDELWQSIRSIQSSNTDGQKGSAHLYVKLSNGDITVYHGDNVRQFRKLDEDERLFLQKNVRKDSWDRVYNTLMNLKSVKMENGGVVGQEIVFDDSGETNTGVIKEIHEITGNYIVATDDGRTVLAEKDIDVISLGKIRAKQPEAKKRFGFFEDGGKIDELILKISQFEKYNHPTPKSKGDKVRTIFKHFEAKGYSVNQINAALGKMKYEGGGNIEKIKVGTFVRYKKDEDFTGGKVISLSGHNAKINNWDGSTIELPIKDLEYVKSWNESKFKEGGIIEKENKEMIDSQTIEARHHVEELSKILTKKNKIEPWVVAKMERATTDLSDVTHYLEGKKMVRGGNIESKSLFDLEYGDVFSIDRNPERPHTMTGQYFLFIGFSEKYAKPEGVSIEAAYFPGSFYGPDHDDDGHTYLTGLKNGDITIISKEKAGEMLLNYQIKNNRFEGGGSLTSGEPIAIAFIDDSRRPGGSDKSIKNDYDLEVVNRTKWDFNIIGSPENIKGFLRDYSIILDDDIKMINKEEANEMINEYKNRNKKLKGGGVDDKGVIYDTKTMKIEKIFNGPVKEYKEFKVTAGDKVFYCDVYVNGSAPENLMEKLERIFRKKYPEAYEDYAHGGMTEHGLKRGDTIVYNSGNEVMVVDKNKNQKLVDLDKGERLMKGGSMSGWKHKMKTGGGVGENNMYVKAYQLTGAYGSKGIAGKVLFEFKKEVEKLNLPLDLNKALNEINTLWNKWSISEGAKIIENEVVKVVKNTSDIEFITATLNQFKWEADTVNNLNNQGIKNKLWIRIPGDFVINVGFNNVDASNFSKKLGGMKNDPININQTDVLGKYKNVGRNNVEIRESLFLLLEVVKGKKKFDGGAVEHSKMSTGGAVKKNGVNQFAEDEKSEGYQAKVFLGKFDDRTFKAQYTDKTWDDGTPVTKYFSRNGFKDVKLKGEYQLVDSDRGWWYIQGPRNVWYAVRHKDYGTPPFEF